ncbi:YbjN domain-containing protein [Gemmatimonadota bacterium]
MAIEIGQVTRALQATGLKHQKLDDERIILGMQCKNVHLDLTLGLQEHGEYLDVDALELATCKKDSPALPAVLQELAFANYQYKLVKFGWDPSDGEIRATVCLPLEDNADLPHEQVGAMIRFLAKVCDDFYPKLEVALKSGRKRLKYGVLAAVFLVLAAAAVVAVVAG